jgi:hypothetical protein
MKAFARMRRERECLEILCGQSRGLTQALAQGLCPWFVHGQAGAFRRAASAGFENFGPDGLGGSHSATTSPE